MGEYIFNSSDFSSESENWTVEQWQLVTQKWSPVTQFAVRHARAIPYEERARRGGNLFEERTETDDPDYFETIANLMGLSDEAINRVIESLPCSVEEIKLTKGKWIAPFNTLRYLPPLAELSHLDTAFHIPLRYKKMIGTLRGLFVLPEKVILPVISFCFRSLNEYRELRTLRAEFAGDQPYFLNLTLDTKEEEARVRQELGNFDIPIVQNGLFKDSQGKEDSFPLPYRDFPFWKGVEVRLTDRPL